MYTCIQCIHLHLVYILPTCYIHMYILVYMSLLVEIFISIGSNYHVKLVRVYYWINHSSLIKNPCGSFFKHCQTFLYLIELWHLTIQLIIIYINIYYYYICLIFSFIGMCWKTSTPPPEPTPAAMLLSTLSTVTETAQFNVTGEFQTITFHNSSEI